jgi:hypothetical protein
MKDFTPYAESLALKELGFDEPCLKFIYIGSNPYVEDGQILEAKNWNKYNTHISVPLFSQAFRFFREKYNLEYVIDINTKFVNNFQLVEKLYKIQIIKSDEYSTEL